MTTSQFDPLVPFYDALIDWPKRLAHESPFYRKWFTAANVHSLLDAACGTGRHAALFASWGLQVDAADLSPDMLTTAQSLNSDPQIRWLTRSLEQPIPNPYSYDAVICVGNSLPLLPDLAAVDLAIENLLHALKPHGILILHLLNFWSIPPGPFVWQKAIQLPSSNNSANPGTLLAKGIHRNNDLPTPHAFVELLAITPDPFTHKPKIQHQSARFLGLEADYLQSIIYRAGARDVTTYGGYQEQPYHRETSTDLILVARKK